jgi:hypothetical protein
MRTEALQTYTPPGFADSVEPTGVIQNGSWRQNVNLNDVAANTNRRMTSAGASTRDEFVNYFNSAAGSLDWQTAYVNRLN